MTKSSYFRVALLAAKRYNDAVSSEVDITNFVVSYLGHSYEQGRALVIFQSMKDKTFWKG